MKNLLVKNASLKPMDSGLQAGVVGVANSVVAKPNRVMTEQVNAVEAAENVQPGLQKLRIGDTQTAKPAPERYKIGSAKERKTSEVPTAGGSADALSDIGQSATAKPKKR